MFGSVCTVPLVFLKSARRWIKTEKRIKASVGSANHATTPFFVACESDPSVHTTLNFDIETERKLSFGVSLYEGKPPHVAVTPMLRDNSSDALHLARAAELEAICKDYLLSKDGKDIWEKTGLEQPSSLAELNKHWSSPVHDWVAKRTGDKFTDIRLKFSFNFQKAREFTAKDLRINGSS